MEGGGREKGRGREEGEWLQGVPPEPGRGTDVEVPRGRGERGPGCAGAKKAPGGVVGGESTRRTRHEVTGTGEGRGVGRMAGLATVVGRGQTGRLSGRRVGLGEGLQRGSGVVGELRELGRENRGAGDTRRVGSKGS